jgi:hypothetical protein
MKYFKFAQISADTGISWAIAQPVSGPSWPIIPDLDLNTTVQLSHTPIYYLAKVSDQATPNPANHIFELTLAEYAEELKQHVMYQLNQEKESIYQQEYDFRNSIFSKYHDTASIAGIYKYEQAKAVLLDPAAEAPEVRAEALARGLSVEVMAERIITNHELFRAKEAKIAGIRGRIQDRLNGYEFDLMDPDASYAEYLTEEVVGTRMSMEFENGEMVEKQVTVTVRKYSLSLPTRFEYE